MKKAKTFCNSSDLRNAVRMSDGTKYTDFTGTHNHFAINVRVLLDIAERITVRHPWADHVRVRSIVMTRTIKRKDITSSVLVPDLSPDTNLTKEALPDLWCDLNSANHLDRDLLPSKVFTFPDVKSRATTDRMIPHSAYFPVLEVDVREERLGICLDVVE